MTKDCAVRKRVVYTTDEILWASFFQIEVLKEFEIRVLVISHCTNRGRDSR
jgi:hypothetical protein